MKVIVPGKACSTRVHNKNYRNFHGKFSLMDILLYKLKDVVAPNDIYVSCEDDFMRDFVEDHGCQFQKRPKRLSENSTPYSEVMEFMVDQCFTDPDEDIMYAACINPLFDEFEQIIKIWESHKDDLDSLAVMHPQKEYLLDKDFRPIGWQFGQWHPASQNLPVMYATSFEASIFKKATFDHYKYFWGGDPYWYISGKPSIDIDTQDDFDLAQVLYAKSH